VKTRLKIQKVILLLIAIFSAHALVCQYGTPIHYTESNGLTDESMYSCAVDNDGFIWFASETGASRFNGFEFEHFKTIEEAANSFLFFKVDHKNRIWGNTVGSSIYCFEHGKWSVFPYNKWIKNAPLNPSRRKNLIGTINQITIFQYENDILLAYDEDEQLKLRHIKNVLDTSTNNFLFHLIRDNQLLLITDNGIKKIDLGFIKEKQENTPDIGYYMKNGSEVFFYKNNKLHPVAVPHSSHINDLLFHANTLNIASKDGLFRYQKVNDTLFAKEQAPLLTIPCASIVIDKRKNLWVCTQLDGVYFFPHLLGKSFVYEPFEGDFFLKALQLNNQYKLFSSYGKVITFTKGKFKIEQNFNTLSYDFQMYKGNAYYLTSTTLFKNNEVFFNLYNGWYKSLLINPLTEEFFIGSGDRLLRVRPTVEVINSNMKPNRIYDLIFFDNQLLSGTDNGVLFYKNKKPEPFDLGPYSYLKNISSIHQAKDSVLFFLSRNSGVLFKHQAQYILLKGPSDLSDAPTCLFSPKPGLMLIGTRRGLNVVHYKTNPLSITHIKSFSNTNGLIDNKINHITFDQCDTQLLITFNNAIQTISLNSLLSTAQDSKLYFKYINTENNLFKSFENIRFQHNENNIEIGFGVIDYALENKKGFLYRLLGVSEKWNNVNGYSVEFSDLEPGNYAFQLKLRNQYNMDNEMITLEFTIVPAYWQTVWFKLIIMLLISFVILWLFDLRHQKIITKERNKNKLDREHASLELEAIKAQINPHFIYNCLNSIQHSIMKNDNAGAEKQLSTFSKLVRETLDYSKTDFISLDKEIAFLDKYLQMEKLRFKEKLEYHIASSVPQNERTVIPCLLIQPFVENAVKHGLSKNGNEVSTIEIDFSLNNNRIECRVEDFGCGIDSNILSQKDLPSGMGLSKNRAQTYNSIYNMDITITIINKNTFTPPQNGTLVTINIPFK
jgi:ligand-binding sensor domain-containing protein